MKSVILLSGGIGSATCLAIAKAENTEPYALSVMYGQRNAEEVEASKLVANALGVIEQRIISVDLAAIGGSALTGAMDVPKDPLEHDPDDIPVTYVPARNSVMLSLALGYAEVVGAEVIYAGVNAVDYSGYPDCRPVFIDAFRALARVATKAAIEGWPIEIKTPLIAMTKAEIILRGIDLGVDFSLTYSCYAPINGRACGHCESCEIRRRGFEALGLTDPALSSP